MNLLQPLHIPLTGTTLIEASAGTGKTYTITTIFLRLLLEKKVGIDQILVVTFTIAATEELRIKLSERLNLANSWLRAPEDCDYGQDPTLAELLATVNSAEAQRLIGDAVARLDDLSVYTIDAMCLRVLQDFAFESGLPMRIEMIADDTEIRRECAKDYWRHVIGSDDNFRIENLLAFARSPDSLLEQLQGVLQLRDAQIIPAYDSERFQNLATDLHRHYAEIFSCWKNNSQRIREVFADEANALNRRSYREASKERIIDWLKTLGERLPAYVHKNFKLLTADWMTQKTKGGCITPTHQFFNLCDEFEDKFNEYKKWQKVAAIVDARNFMPTAIDDYKSKRNLVHFEDMRSRLDRALAGDSAVVLAEKIRSLWPFALIDEFQDTDAEQFRIFNRVYAEQPDSGFFMIGDPKQAIYSFRGADVFTYMNAVGQAGNTYTLGTNWRSTPSMVNAVNAIFGSRNDAFIFDRIPFSPVESVADHKKYELKIENETVAPFKINLFDNHNKEAVAVACASDIAQLLNGGASQSAMINGTSLSSGDIAVLVRSHTESQLMQQALRRVGVRSVSMPNRTVFQTVEATDLLLVLEAMAFPGFDGHLRAALATALVGYNRSDLESLRGAAWDPVVDNFIKARDLWRERGFMHALQSLISDLNIAVRLLRNHDGEQRMTNLLQLAELLQVQSREIASFDELILWLQNEIKSSRPGDDALQLRLESDEGLVQIVTMHKSKGLEYPVVYVPFPSALNTGKPKAGGSVIFHDREQFSTVIDVGSDEISDNRALELEEKLSEELRLLYVTLTRARSSCVLYWGDAFQIKNSALWYLIHGDLPEADIELMHADLRQLAEASGGSIEVAPISADQHVRFNESQVQQALSLPAYSTKINQRWGLSSYTGLLRGEDPDLPDHDEAIDEPADDVIQTETVTSAEEQLIASLPAGARTGQLLHEIFEYMDFTDTVDLEQRIDEALQRYGNLARTTTGNKQPNWNPAIKQIINNSLQGVLTHNINPDVKKGLSLCDIAMSDRLNEMEFFFSVSHLSPDTLKETLADTQYSDVANGLNFSAFEGLMQGFIDMVVRKDQRYYIVDYKSNYLGDSLDDYSQQSISDAIRGHRYDLQYLIYTLALHRYLKGRLPDYNYDTHFGGVFYLFVRGMRPESNSGVWCDLPSAAIIHSLDLMLSNKSNAA